MNANIIGEAVQAAVSNEVSEVTVTDLFNKWKELVIEEVDTSNLGTYTHLDNELYYEYFAVSFEFSEDMNKKTWSILKSAKLSFECDIDESLNFEILLSQVVESSKWYIVNSADTLRYMTSFKAYVGMLKQHGTKIVVDKISGEDDVSPTAEPEDSYS